jgi:surfeit locus 1 family protein
VVFGALGVWQLERRTWKLDLIRRVNARVHAPPQPPPPRARWAEVDAQRDEYRRIRASGVLLNDQEILVQALTERGAGWWVMTPLRTDQGVVLINRGFVPPERKAASTRRRGAPQGEVTITGLLRMSEPHGGFLRSNDPAAGRWYSRDVAAIARARHLQGVAPFFIDADAAPNPGGYPVGGLTVVTFRNAHLAYALTWFALSGLSAFGALLLLRRSRH